MEQSSTFENSTLPFSEELKAYFKEIAKWAFFLSIIGFIGLGLTVLFGLFFSAFMGAMPSNSYNEIGISPGILGMIYVVIGMIYFFPVYYLFNFAKKLKSALLSNNTEELTAAFSNLKSHYKFVGIFTIVIISLYLLIFIIAIFAGLSSI